MSAEDVPQLTLAVLGGTGRTGRHLVDHALAAGHRVRLLTRDPSRVPRRPGMVAVGGHPADPGAVREVAREASCVISALGHDGGIHQPQDARTRAAEAVVAALSDGAPQRLVAVASAGVLPAGDRLRGEDGAAEYRHVFADHRGVLRALEASALDWTLVCPPYIPDGAASGRALLARESYPQGGGGAITAGELARVVLELAVDPGAPRGRVGVAEPAA